jgi:hypothetical protein
VSARRAGARLVALAPALVLCGCIGILVPTGSRRDPSLEAARWLGEREAAVSRAEVLLHLGEPQFAGEQGALFVYRWHDARALGFLCVGGYYSAACTPLSIDREFDLLLHFGADGLVTETELLSGLAMGEGSGTECTKRGLCVAGTAWRLGAPQPILDEERAEPADHVLYERDAAPDDRRWAAALGGNCSLAVLPHSAGLASVIVDGRFAGFASRDGWLGVWLQPGEHEIAVLDPGASADTLGVLNARAFACAAGERVVLTQASAGPFGLASGALTAGAPPSAENARRKRRYLNAWASAGSSLAAIEDAAPTR